MRATLLALVSALLIGASTIASKLLLAYISPAWLGAAMFVGATLSGLLVRRGPLLAAAAPYSHRQLAAFVLAALLGAVIAPWLVLHGLQSTSAALAAVLGNLEGILAVVMARCWFRERLGRGSLMAVLLILGGVLLFSLRQAGQASGFSSGALLLVVAYACWALDMNLMKQVVWLRAEDATCIRGLLGALVLALVAWAGAEPWPAISSLCWALMAGVFGFGISFLLTLQALPRIGSARTGALLAAAPVFAYLLSLFTEADAAPISLSALAALLLVMAGIALSVWNVWRRPLVAAGVTAAPMTVATAGQSYLPVS